MGKILGFLLILLSQFAGGPGPVENNLVRFGLPAILWAILFYIAWSRQRTQDLPRERWLVWGFGLAFVREIYMFGQMAYRLLGTGDVEANCDVIQPLEHGLAMAAMIVVAGAFLRYILEDTKIARDFLRIGLGITAVVFVFTSWTWPRQLASYPQLKFHQTWAAWLFHVPLSISMGIAIYLLWRKRGWLRNIVASALAFYFFSEILLLLNYATARAYNAVICPIGNSLHIFAIPLLSYVYLREQSVEKKQADEALIAYRNHLEELVDERTAELTTLNVQLKQEVLDRAQAEEALERITHRYELILESAGEGICGIDHQGRIVFVNPAVAKMLGYSAAELINRPCQAIWHNNHTGDHPHLLEDCPIYQGYSQGIQRYGDDEYFRRRDGTGFPVRYFSNPIYEKNELAGAVVVFQDITERKRNEAEIARHNASLATQNAVAAILSQSLDIEENLTNVLELVRNDSEMEIGLIYFLEHQDDSLTLHLSIGLDSKTDLQTFAGDCACQWISRQALIRKQAVESSPNALAPEMQTPCMDRAGIRHLVSVPLMFKGRAVGVMTLGALQASSMQSHKLDLLTAIGQQIGMAIENARMYKDAENWAGELARLHEASSFLTASFELSQVHVEIARQSAWLMKCQRACVICLNGQTGKFEVAASFGLDRNELYILQTQLPNWMLLSDPAIQSRTFQANSSDLHLPEAFRKDLELQAALITPIWSSVKPQNFILCLEVQTSRHWHAREVELIESLANRAAVALVNADLHQQLELAAALEERQRIAADMHDGLAQTLSLLGLRVDHVQDLIEDESIPGTEEAIDAIREAVSRASNEVRHSIASLQAAPRPLSSLQEVLQKLLEGLQIEVDPCLRLNLGVDQALFVPAEQMEQIEPIVQEAILNACRHAQAQIVSIQLEKAREKILITVEDDGIGFDLECPARSDDHFGLSIMQARAARMNGQLQIVTSPGNGTRITLSWIPDPAALRKETRPAGIYAGSDAPQK